jgi:hypothetical protein
MTILYLTLAFLAGYLYRHLSKPPAFSFRQRRRAALRRAKSYERRWA